MAEETKEQISADDWGAAMAEQAAAEPTPAACNRMCSNNSAARALPLRTTTST